MKDWKQFIKKNSVVIILALIILGGVFVRVYNFEDWLYFKADQVRDAKLATAAFENGPGELTLLGPRAAGTFLRLGPAFYYMQYASTKIFNSVEPHIFAFPDLLFAILTIPLLFYFLRQFFSRRNSLLLTAIYSFSFIIIQYARFAWNPNSIAFWGLLFILSLYKASGEENSRKAGYWLLGTAFSYAIASQLHFVAFVGYPIVIFLFWFKYFPKKINWKYWIGAILIGLFFYIPVIISDVHTNGDNLNQFIYAVTAKTGDGDSDLREKMRQVSIAFSMFLTSFGHKDSFISTWNGSILIFLGLGSLGYLWRTCKEKRSFLYLILIWFLVFVALQLKTDTSMKPRFFMPIAAVPFIFLGFIYVFLDKFKSIILTGLILFSFLIILLLNYSGIKMAYGYYSNQDKGEISRKIFLKQNDAKVLEQHKLATKYMAEAVLKSGKIACFYSVADYERTYEFLFEVYYPDVQYDRISKAIEDKNACQYFSVATADSEKRTGNNYKDYFDFKGSKKFGRIEIWNLIAKEKFINYKKEEDLARKENQEVEEKTDEEIAEELEESLQKTIGEIDNKIEEKTKAPDRLERVLWRDVFGK